MDKKSIQIIHFLGNKLKWRMWSVKVMERLGIEGYGILLIGDAEIPSDNADETKYNGVTATLELLNKTAYNRHILAQENTMCFQIIVTVVIYDHQLNQTQKTLLIN